MFYTIVRAVLRFFMCFVFRIKVVGKENVPMDGSAMLAVNHRSNWDPVIAGVTSPRKLRFMAKSELFKNKLIGNIITACGAFPIQRGKGDIGAIKGALTLLKNGELMLIFPEGRRVKENENVEAKPGAVMLAIRSQVPIIPTYISGKYGWLSKITVTFGEPVYFDEYYDTKPVVEELQLITNDLMKIIRSYKVPDKKRKKD